MPRNPGFLTDSDREKLTGEQSLENYSNVSQWKERVRDEIRQAHIDMGLLEASPYWKDEDFAKVYRDSLRNTHLYSCLSDDGIQNGLFTATAQTKIYGDTIQKFAQNLEDLDIDGNWQNEENATRAVQEMFIRNTVQVMLDVFELVGVTDKYTVEEFVEDVWPEKDRALEIAKDELSND